MGNTIKTLTAGDITRKALSILHNNLVFTKLINKEYNDRFARTGAKNGGYLEIREPNQFTVRTGAAIDVQDVTETTQQLVLATQKGVDVNFSSAELTLSLDDFADRILEPAMSRLAAQVDADVIANCYIDVAKLENSTFGTKPTLADLLAARALLNQGLTPISERYCMVDALAANGILTDTKTLFQSASELSRQYEQGLLGTVAGFKFYESEMTPVHTNGTRTTAGKVDLSYVTNGDSTLSTSHSSGEKFAAGDVITVAGVYEINPETKEPYSFLKQWAVNAAYSCDGTADALPISPKIYKSGPKQNCYCADWTSTTAASVVDAAGSSGDASTAYTNSLCFHKNAFTFVSADLEMPQGVHFAARKVFEGVSMRIVRAYDINNDAFPCRIDVLFGSKCLRPEWAVRMSS
jgi:hypothetical protein